METVVAEFCFGVFALGLSFGGFRLITSALDLSLESLRLDFFVCILSFGLGSFAWELRWGTSAWDMPLAIFRLVIFA